MFPAVDAQPRIFETCRVLDLGCKTGGALGSFCKTGSRHFGPDAQSIRPAECVGVDRAGRYRQAVESRGYRFLELDVTKPGALESLPQADYVLAWDFLEHMPDKTWGRRLIAAMVAKARRGAWLLFPSFEQDPVTGEGRLKEHGLRFAWTTWRGHPCHWTLADTEQTLHELGNETGRKFSFTLQPRGEITTTDDRRVVPLTAPNESACYMPEYGPKPSVALDPPVFPQFSLVAKIAAGPP